MDTFDSRALRRADCYGQRFMKAGTYPYTILPAFGHCFSSQSPFTVRVLEKLGNEKLHQETVKVRLENGHYTATPAEVAIGVGDIVLWNCPDGNTAPFMVLGEKPFFSSERLVNESGFSHAFGSPGEYHWKDAYGSEVNGIIRVKETKCDHAADLQRWRKSLSKGTLVTISEGLVDPREIDLIVGQTVFFLVTKGPGISITDTHLLSQQSEQRNAVGSTRRR